MDFRIIENELARIASLFRGKLPDGQIQDMMDLARAGEPGVAFENLCIQLYEHDVVVDEEILEALRRIGESMNIGNRYCDLLESKMQKRQFDL